jgi:hypothetical protein
MITISSVQWISLIVSVLSVLVCYTTMKKIWWSPILGLCSQVSWYALAIVTGAYPLLVAITVYSILYTMSIRRWYAERTK